MLRGANGIRPRIVSLTVGLALVLPLAACTGSAGETSEASDVTTTTQPAVTTAPPLTTTTTAPNTTIAPTSTEAAQAGHGATTATMLEPGDHPGRAYVIYDVLVAPELLLAIGDAAGDQANGMRDGALWTSPDGSTWTRSRADGVFEFGGKFLRALGSIDGRFVIGGASCDSEERCPFAPAIWTSTDAVTWTRVPQDTSTFGDSGVIADFVSHEGVLLGSGMSCTDGECAPAIWRTTDGLTWSRIPFSVEPAVVGPLAAGPDGVIAFGSAQVVDEEGFADDVWAGAAWTSPDGLGWTRLALDPTVFGDGETAFMSPTDVTHGPAGFVAVGWEGDAAFVWVSSDGTAWERVGDGSPALADASMTAVIATPTGYVAAGPEWVLPGEPTPTQPPILWTSSDGRSWERHQFEGPAIGALRALALVDGRVLAMGQRDEWTVGLAAAWLIDLDLG
jgi:hypothetical protein